jgi:ComEC/Rec2-related protein
MVFRSTAVLCIASSLTSMYRLDLVLVFVVAFGLRPWRSLWSYIGAVVWTLTVLVGAQVFLEWRYWYPSPEIRTFIAPSAAFLRMFLQNRIDQVATGALHGFLYGVLLGDRSELTPVFQEGFRSLGISHMLAVSGFHVGFWVVLGRPMKWLFKLRNWRLLYVLFMGIFLCVYAVVVGAGPSVIRAVGTFCFAAFALQMDWRIRPLHWPLLVAWIMWWHDPGVVQRVGFQLSFSAVCGILMGLNGLPASEFLQSWQRESLKGTKLSFLVPVQVSLSAWTATLPLVMYHFAGASPYFLIGNLLIVPLFVAYIWSALFAVLFAPVLPCQVLELWNSSFEYWVDWVLKLADGISQQGLLEFFSQVYLQ